ncbi:glycoside hydrolase family 10 protein [Pseudocercospora fijiensis CIRAD86]|uniref:Beta-xylanase n=1 Tax=Pseudocercospora fijiensis (strain CIRAD86) TaxID=383855 RepID=M3A7S3_PSEFD|nr:glycoside hydrolase family 10 protein [Pseudocercospora fijiensis CIRAD86]EME80661.1 glycoside hydrolase family 10 protein [Pseudocercospora fijiensis CIRAD86]
MHPNTLLTSILSLSAACTASPQNHGYGYGHGYSSPTTGLAKAMRENGRSFIGTAMKLRLDDTSELAIISNNADFNSITPEEDFKWALTEPGLGNYTFEKADAIAEWVVEHGYQLHCHTLLWHNQLSDYVAKGNFSNATLIEYMKGHIQAVAGRYKGICTAWDVVNEGLEENGTYRESVFYKTIGEAYIPFAFKFAHHADPHAKLFYNDYNLESAGDKWLGAQRIVKLVREYGGKIHGVGLQAHLTCEESNPAPNQTTLVKALEGLTALDVDVTYSEVDVRMKTPSTPEKLQTQAEVYERVAASCMEVKRCIGMTTWGVSDKYSWIPSTFPGEGTGDMWDENYQKKPAYDGFLKGIQSAQGYY